jgi:3-oxoacyl-[acyl-carrier-protein] synthase-3
MPIFPSTYIKGVGSYAPANVVTNDDLTRIVDTTDEWIFTRTGIRERRIAKEETTSDLASKAGLAAIESAGLKPSDIDLLIIATITPDMLFPNTACLAQTKMGLRAIPCFDVEAACSGFLYSMEIARGMMITGNFRNALVIGAEKLSSITNWEDRSTCVLFGDGAGAVVLSQTEQQGVGILGATLGADGAEKDILYVPAGGCAKPATAETVGAREHFMRMQGNLVFKAAVKAMAQSAIDILQRYNITTDQLACVVPHQANNRIIEALSTRLSIGLDRFKVNLDRYGNTSAASIPLALDEAVKSGQIKKDDYVLLVAFGAGLTWGATLIKWH